jgi:hypothetical protein
VTAMFAQTGFPMPFVTHLPGELVATPTAVVRSASQANSSGIGGAVVATLLSATILAALIAAAVNIMLARRKSREEERATS